MDASPPVGRGVYARDQSVEVLSRFDFIALHAERRDTRRKAAELRERGRDVWLYSTPERWRPDVAVGQVGVIEAKARRLGAVGFIANPESGWPALDETERDVRAATLGRRLRSAASSMRVGVTSYPLWPGRGALSLELELTAWGSPQLYQDEASGAQLAGYLRIWARAFGYAVPSIAGYTTQNDSLMSPDEIAAYLEKLPRAPGFVAWTESGGPSAAMLEALLSHPVGDTAPPGCIHPRCKCLIRCPA